MSVDDDRRRLAERLARESADRKASEQAKESARAARLSAVGQEFLAKVTTQGLQPQLQYAVVWPYQLPGRRGPDPFWLLADREGWCFPLSFMPPDLILDADGRLWCLPSVQLAWEEPMPYRAVCSPWAYEEWSEPDGGPTLYLREEMDRALAAGCRRGIERSGGAWEISAPEKPTPPESAGPPSGSRGRRRGLFGRR